jgi:hypothetical protein
LRKTISCKEGLFKCFSLSPAERDISHGNEPLSTVDDGGKKGGHTVVVVVVVVD